MKSETTYRDVSAPPGAAPRWQSLRSSPGPGKPDTWRREVGRRMAAGETRDMRIKLNGADHHPGTWAATSEAIERGEGITRTKARSKTGLSDDPSGRPDDPHDRTDRDGGG